MKKLIGKDTLPKVGGLAAGAIGANLLVSKIPMGNDKIKNGIGIVAGIFLSGQKGFMGNVGNGIIAQCAGNLGKSFGIGGTMIGEVEDVIIEGLEDEDNGMNGSDSPGSDVTDERNLY